MLPLELILTISKIGNDALDSAEEILKSIGASENED